MINLIRSDFKRLFTSLLFWLAVIIMIVLGIYYTGEHVSANESYIEYNRPEYIKSWEVGSFFEFGLLAALFLGVFSGIFVGTEYRENTIRNKLIVGHSRIGIYLSNLLTVTVSEWMFALAYILGSIMRGYSFFKGFESETSVIVEYFAVAFLAMLAISSLFTMLSMLVDRKAVGPVLCIIVIGVLFFAMREIESKLSEQTYLGFNEETFEVYYEYAVTGTKRTVFEYLQIINPLNQLELISKFEPIESVKMMAFSGGATVLTTVIGILSFKKKNIR